MRWTAGFLEIKETLLADAFDMRSITTGALLNEPQHDKTNKIICALSLIRVYAVRMKKKGLVSGKNIKRTAKTMIRLGGCPG